jgi:hypothetical protein
MRREKQAESSSSACAGILEPANPARRRANPAPHAPLRVSAFHIRIPLVSNQRPLAAQAKRISALYWLGGSPVAVLPSYD